MSLILPPDIHSTSRDPALGRVKVEDGSAALAENRAFRVSQPLALDTTTLPSIQIAVNSPINFMLQQQTITCDLGGILYQVYRSEQGSVATPFEDSVPTLRRNLRTDAPPYVPQISVLTGGVFTPGVGESPVDTIRVRSGTNFNKATNVSGSENNTRGLPPNIYYIIISALAGITGAINGVLEILYDER